jgi:AraC-like DNA-binding protein
MKELYHKYFEKVQTRFIVPPIALKPFILKYMFYENAATHIGNLPFRALPNGNVELFFHFNGSQVHFYEKNKHFVLSNFIAGVFGLDYPMKIKISCPADTFKGLSVTLSHEGVNRLLNMAVSDLTNQIINIDYFWGLRGKETIDKVIQAKRIQTKIHILNQFFTRLLSQPSEVNQQEIQYIIKFLEQKSGKITVDEIAHNLSLSYKSIYRKFNTHVGLSPKTYLKIIRFNRACRLLYHFPYINWGELVYHCGYYDQAHFINEFHHIMKESPMHFIKLTGGKFYLNRPFCFH